MTHSDDTLSNLLSQIEFYLQEPLDFRRTDTETTRTKVRILVAAAVYMNTLSASDFGGRAGPVRAPGMVEQVIAAAFQTYSGEDPYPDNSRRPPCSCVASSRAPLQRRQQAHRL